MSAADAVVPGATPPPMRHVDALPEGSVLGEFEIQALLGVGGFGMVYRAYDHSLQRQVAIKEYMPSSIAGRVSGAGLAVRASNDEASFQAGLKSFIDEARLLAKFDHPSLVKVYRFWEANNTAYMAMPLYRGMTLKQARASMRVPPSEAWLRTVLWSVLEALRVLHTHSTLHRDVSPDNIFLQDVGPPVLLDLGAARRALAEISQKHTAVLKVNYAPIEQYADAKDLREGPWSDLYALAAVVHGCLRNESPLPATFRAVKDRMPTFAHIAKTVEAHFGVPYSAAFVQTIEHALAIQPHDRPQSVEAFAVEMKLRAPEGVLQFDWRQEVGPIPPVPTSEPVEADFLPTQFVVAEPAANKVGGARPHRAGAATSNADASISKGPAKTKSWPYLLVAVAAMLVFAAGAWYLASQKRADTELVPAPDSAPVPSVPAIRKELRTICADTNFLTRPMCLFRECQKPANAKLPLCVEANKRWEDKNKAANRN